MLSLLGQTALLFIQLLIALITRSAGNMVPSPRVSSSSSLLLIGFRLKKCVFEVLNLVANCLDDENELQF